MVETRRAAESQRRGKKVMACRLEVWKLEGLKACALMADPGDNSSNWR